jgi:hypothetical protein
MPLALQHADGCFSHDDASIVSCWAEPLAVSAVSVAMLAVLGGLGLWVWQSVRA